MCTHIAGRSAGLSYQATCDTRGESAGAHAQSTIWKNRKVDYRPRKAKEAADAELAASSSFERHGDRAHSEAVGTARPPVMLAAIVIFALFAILYGFTLKLFASSPRPVSNLGITMDILPIVTCGVICASLIFTGVLISYRAWSRTYYCNATNNAIYHCARACYFNLVLFLVSLGLEEAIGAIYKVKRWCRRCEGGGK